MLRKKYVSIINDGNLPIDELVNGVAAHFELNA